MAKRGSAKSFGERRLVSELCACSGSRSGHILPTSLSLVIGTDYRQPGNASRVNFLFYLFSDFVRHGTGCQSRRASS